MKRYLQLLQKHAQHKVSIQSRLDEKGIALVMTLLLGTTLFAGISALMVRQLAARRHVASESYRQIAELAANNGLNQILSTLNNDKPGKYAGYLLGMSNIRDANDLENNFLWERINTETSPIIPELCTEIIFPDHPEGTEKKWPTDAIKEHVTETDSDSLRKDGKDNLHSYYRLRSYKNPPKSNQLDNGEATFIIEGIVKRDGMESDQYLARARLERSLKVEAAVLKMREQDWAILFAENYSLSETTLNGKGLITWEVPMSSAEEISKDCGTINLSSRISNTNSLNIIDHEKIWPVANQTLQSDVMNNLFYIKGNVDGYSSEKAWRIDDTDPTSPTNHNIFNDRYERNGAKEIIFTEAEFCPESTSDCHIFIEHIDLRESKVYIENERRPVVIHLKNPSGSNGTFQLSDDALICGVNKGETDCNNKPERFVIVGDSDSDNVTRETSCGISSLSLKTGENNIPHSFILLKDGSVELTSPTSINGAIWAKNICANSNKLDVTIPSNFMPTVYDLWGWKDIEFAGLGRSMSRTIRGSGYDTFKRF